MLLSKLKSAKFARELKIVARTYYNVKRKVVEDENYLSKQLSQQIKVQGPITVADYMKAVLTHPVGGYYMHKDVFGESGDFITSPEISQIFGEMIAVWFLNEWQVMGSPKPFQIIELGPGRGTLCSDILKVFSHFQALHSASVALVEISPMMSNLQAKKLCSNSHLCNDNSPVYRKGLSKYDIPVEWYKQLRDIPNNFSLILAHEFFDALPIHKFHKTYTGYREVLIDIDPKSVKNEDIEPKFRYVLARDDTPMTKVLLKPTETRDHIEISPDSILIYKEICEKVYSQGGVALICDYGHYGTGMDTFRAFKKHKQVNPLEKPGTADLTADVDFKLIRQVANDVGNTISFGPVTQREFLLKTGLEYRYQALKDKLKDQKQIQNLDECYHLLVDNDKMGERFKFFSIFPETAKKLFERYPVVGFQT